MLNFPPLKPTFPAMLALMTMGRAREKFFFHEPVPDKVPAIMGRSLFLFLYISSHGRVSNPNPLQQLCFFEEEGC